MASANVAPSSTRAWISSRTSLRSAVKVNVPELSAISTPEPPVKVIVSPRFIEVVFVPSVISIALLVIAEFGISVIVLEDPLIVLLVKVSVEL